MAVEGKERGTEFKGRQFAIGANVLVAIVLVVALVAVLQWAGYRFHGKSDWTSSGVNSLSDGTEALLRGLDTKVRLTSTFFETDLESEDQKKFRRSTQDLLNLYQSANRSMIEVDYVNPLQDHDARQELLNRIAEKPAFVEQAAGHKEVIDTFREDMLPRMTDLLASELEALAGMSEQMSGQGSSILPQIELLLQSQQQDLTAVGEDIESAVSRDVPRYGAAVDGLRSLYSSLSKSLSDIGKAGKEVAGSTGGLTQDQYDFLAGAGERYQGLIEALNEQVTRISELPALDLEDLLRDLAPNSNAVVVETDQDARVLGFSEVWPLFRPDAPSGAAGFKDRAFRGEEKTSSAILQLTSDEQTAVVFARFGGPPLFGGGFMRGQPQGRYTRIKEHLEDLNFTVHEWDLGQQTEPPEIDPPPAKTIYIVLKPISPPPNPMMPQQQPQFGPEQRQAVLDAIAESGRALFVGGWYSGPYEYEEYLKDQWGVDVMSGLLLLQAVPVSPGKFRLSRGATIMQDVSYSDHPIVNRLGVLRSLYPNVAPVEPAEEPPDGVQVQKLIWMDEQDGLWGARDVQKYAEQTRNEYMVKVEDDPVGPFTIAVAAENAEQGRKLVMVGAQEVFADEIAFTVEAVLTAEGLALRSRNPGNLTLLVNSLHWLNDKEEIMNLGGPVDVSTLQIAEGPTLSFLKVLAVVIWPALAAVVGGVVWFVRRR